MSGLLAGWCSSVSIPADLAAGPEKATPPVVQPVWGELKPGACPVGFRLEVATDLTRSADDPAGVPQMGRPVRIYWWYPAKEPGTSMTVGDYTRLAEQDFAPAAGIPPGLPVPLGKGLTPEQRQALLVSRTAASRGAAPAAGKFPVLVFGQGLYYESPVSNLVICEYLASHGFIVATCPLAGTRHRLVNLNIEDLETAIRDLEWVLSRARALPAADLDRAGVIGYDLGGMAGLTLCLRHPELSAFASLDAGILTPHRSDLPASHPSYREDRFVIPWMHLTQARFMPPEPGSGQPSNLFARKTGGDSYLVPVPATSHGSFSSYAMMGIKQAVPGYWGTPAENEQSLHEDICRRVLLFFEGYLKGRETARRQLQAEAVAAVDQPAQPKIFFKAGVPVPPSRARLIHLLITKGPEEAKPVIEQAQAAAGGPVLDEAELNWLGYHFLYWWGREAEAAKLFQLGVSLFPGSANLYDSLGEAWQVNGNIPAAIESYRRSLELDPNNANARAALQRLQEQQQPRRP